VSSITEIAIIRTSSIGDVVLASATLDLLERTSQACGQKFKVHWIGRSPSAELINQSFNNVNVVYAPATKSPEEIVDKIRNSHFIIDLQQTPRSKKICKVFRKWSKRKVYNLEKRRWERFKLVWDAYFRARKRDLEDADLIADERQFESAAKLLAAALLDSNIIDEKTADLYKQARPKLKVLAPPKDRLFWNRLLESQWIAISAGASFENKKAPKLIFTEVLSNLRNSLFDVEMPRIVFLGDSNDSEVTAEIIESLNWPELVLDLTGKTNLSETLAVLSQCKVLLSNDSSLPHMAEAIGKDAAVLFGPTIEKFGFAAHRPTSKVFSVPLGCRPCSKHGKTPCRFEDKQCFYEIDRTEITDFLRAKLDLREDRDIRNFKGSNI
jgi:ADP-heptose:LPS heptosyltransferase